MTCDHLNGPPLSRTIELQSQVIERSAMLGLLLTGTDVILPMGVSFIGSILYMMMNLTFP